PKARLNISALCLRNGFQALIAAIKRAPVTNDVSKTGGNCARKCGSVNIAPKSFICARPPAISKPTGVCMKALADKIQNAENTEPRATSHMDIRRSRLDNLFHPNTQIPKNVDSKKNASNPSIASDGPNTSPTKRE